MNADLLASIFILEYSTGRLFWKAPPPNHADKIGMEAGYICKGKGKNKSYWQIRAANMTMKRSQVVFAIANRRWSKLQIDHINGNSLDDRPANLRECTARQNAWNTKRAPSKSGLPQGVSLFRGRYRARISVLGRCEVVGIFDTPDAAHAAYNSRRMEVFGEYA